MLQLATMTAALQRLRQRQMQPNFGVPMLLSATIGAAGTSISLVFDRAVTFGAGSNGGFSTSLSGGAAAMSYLSGSGTNTLVYSLGRTVNLGETGTFAYTQPGNGIESVGSLIDTPSFAGAAVTNNSTAGSPPVGDPSDITTFTITSATGGSNLPFSIGHVFKRGDVLASDVVGGDTALNVVARTYWPDGSVRTAQVSGRKTLTAGVASTVTLRINGTVTGGSALSIADLKTAMSGQTCSIACGAFGTVSWSGTDYDSPLVSWVSSPEMSSWIYRKPVGADAHLVGWIEIRLYAGGAVEVLPWIENGYLTGSSHTNKSATYVFTLGGSQRFNAVVNLLNFTRTPLVSGSAVSYWLGADPDIIAKHNAAYMMATDLVPPYVAVTSPSAAQVTSLPTTYTPLQRGSWPSTMGDAGYDLSIGLLPEWDVLYLTTTSAAPWKALQWNAYSAGRYGVHFRDVTSHRCPDLRGSSRVILHIDDGGNHGVVFTGVSSTTTYTPAGSGGSPPQHTNTHEPAAGYMAALVTGRFFHMETVHFLAMSNWLRQTDTNRGTNGLLRTEVGACTVRGAAWSLRTLYQALTITPTSDPLHAVFKASVEANIDAYHAKYIAQTNNPFGWVEPSGDYSGPGNGVFSDATWQQDFFTAITGYATLLQMPIGATQQQRLADFFQYKAKSIVGRLGDQTSTQFLYRDATFYEMAIAPSDTPNFANGTGPWYASWGATYDACVARNGSPGSRVIGDLRTGNIPDATSYWGNLTPAIAYAVRLNVPGAAEGFARISGEAGWASLVTNFNNNPVWSVSWRNPQTETLHYSSTFGLTQSPMVDDGGWIHAGVVAGTGALLFNSVNTTNGVAHAAGTVTDYDDSVACRAGWNNNYHRITGVIHIAPGYSPGVNHEIQLNAAINIHAGRVKLYSIIWSLGGSVQFTRWNGVFGVNNDFTLDLPVTGPGVGRSPVDGDVMELEYDATNTSQVVLRFYVNGTLAYTCTDNTAGRILTGNPGMAFFPRAGSTVSSFGFKFWSARAGLPSWLSGVAVNAWKEIPNSAMSAAPVGMPNTTPPTNPASRMDAWNGLVTKGRGVYSVRQGGHNDYYGNEVLYFNLDSATPAWEMIKPSSPFSGGLIIDNTSRYSDGSPASIHGYAHQRYVWQRNWFMSVGTTAVPINGGTTTECLAYDIKSNTYQPSGWIPNSAAMAVADNAIYDDPATGNIYHAHGFSLHRYNQSANTWSLSYKDLSGVDYYGIAGVACTDTLRRRAILLAGDPAGRNPTLHNLLTDGVSNVSPSGDLSIVNSGGHYGMTYCPVTDRFYAMTGGANAAGLYEMHPTTWAISAKSTSGASGMAAAAATGVYTRFTYVPSLGGIVYFPQYSSNAWFLRLH